MTADTTQPFAFTISAADVAAAGGAWHGVGDQVTVRGAQIDSRALRGGELFVCLPGNNVDGHDFIDAAIEQGAAAVLVERMPPRPVPVPVFRALPREKDAASAVTSAVALWHGLTKLLRQRYAAAHPATRWLAITGSNGKTTVKTLLRAALSPLGAVHATAGNLNNHLGVPLTMFATPPDQQAVIIECGTNNPGEIATLGALAQPHIAAVTNIGPAHLDGLGDLPGVAREKTSLFTCAKPGSTVLIGVNELADTCVSLGADVDAVAGIIAAAAMERQLIQVGGPGCPIHGDAREAGITLRTPVGAQELFFVGSHNLSNAALAWHTALAAGVEPLPALQAMGTAQPVSGRLQPQRIGPHVLFDDSYNANPASMRAGLHTWRAVRACGSRCSARWVSLATVVASCTATSVVTRPSAVSRSSPLGWRRMPTPPGIACRAACSARCAMIRRRRSPRWSAYVRLARLRCC